MRYGFCDALGTPRALGPLHDIARVSPDLAAMLATTTDRHAIFTAFLESLDQSVVVMEDAHWADEATLDLLLFVGRRISGSSALIIVTYRARRSAATTRSGGSSATWQPRRPYAGCRCRALTQEAVARAGRTVGPQRRRPLRGDRWEPVLRHRSAQRAGDQLPSTVRDAVLAGRLG